ncbi:MAG TPA: tRNA epoxyqueuosine(34) reductase QueG [Flavobacteriaceae bacterium]|nr:tRNA epoxyqueuosine(34) reductase QueG [Flavobacteriaceae bacterium]
MSKEKHTAMIKKRALELGFLSCGISKAQFLEEEAPRLEDWLKKDYHAQMGYMENHFDKRLDPTKLVPGAKSVISLLYNYYPAEQQIDKTFKISKYAYGQDYHHVVKAKMRELFHYIEQEIGAIEGRYFVDSAPVLDKAWAARSGLGWIGKHTLMLTKQVGSFFFISEIICDLELEYDGPVTDHCGTCTACIDACPTGAIVEDKVVDANKCISYLTIEFKDALPSYMDGQMQDWVFGCDICQDVCPWNRFSKAHQEPLFNPHPDLLSMKKEDWISLDEDRFQDLFRKSAVKRTKFSGLTRNIDFVSKSKDTDK